MLLGKEVEGAYGARPARDNNFGLIRLALAFAVILSHSPELIDGNPSREPLMRLSGTTSLGGLAVAGFFIISGYLITQSFDRRPSLLDYAVKRGSRIVPGYFVSFALCAFVLAPFAGASVSPRAPELLSRLAGQIIGMRPPIVPGVFGTLPYDALNGSMWTIAYEVRCYALVALAGVCGLFRGRTRLLLPVLASVLLAATIIGLPRDAPPPFVQIFGFPDHIVPLAASFAVGATLYVMREHISYTGPGATLSALLLIILISVPTLASASVSVFCGYLLLWLALAAPTCVLSRVTNRVDISYGVYLYAYPIQNSLIYFGEVHDPWLLTVITLPLAALFGYLSWILIESPALQAVKLKMAEGNVSLPWKTR